MASAQELRAHPATVPWRRHAPSGPSGTGPGAPPDKSLFGQKIPCSGNRNSLFGFVREFAGKAAESLRNFASTFAEMARNSQNTLIISLFSGKSPLATLELRNERRDPGEPEGNSQRSGSRAPSRTTSPTRCGGSGPTDHSAPAEVQLRSAGEGNWPRLTGQAVIDVEGAPMSGPTGRNATMVTAMIRDGNTIRVEWPIPWYGRLFSLPLLAASLCLFYYVLLALRNHVIGLADASDEIVDLLISCALGLVIGVPGLMVATFRYFAVVDMALRQVTAIRQFGPLKFRRPRNLSDFNFISVTDDGEKRGLVFGVNLCCQKRTIPVT